MLEKMKIARPCGADWAAMSGDDKVRFCQLCQLNVYNLSGMKREDAEALVASREGKLCVRFYQRADGTVLTQDCPVGFAAVKRRVALIAAGVAGFLSLGAASILGFRAVSDLKAAVSVRPSPEPLGVPQPEPEPLMGKCAPIMGDVAIVTSEQ